MVKKDLSNYVGASGDAAPRGMSSFAASLEAELENSPMPIPAEVSQTDAYKNMKELLGCAEKVEGVMQHQYVTRKQLVLFAMFVQKCFEAQGVHMDACINHLINCFTKLVPNRDAHILAMDNEYPFKDDQYVSPKIIEDYTGYSDTTVRKKLREATIKGQITCILDPICDKSGKQLLDKNGQPRTTRPRYRWGDIRILFGDRRKELLSARDKKHLEQARALLNKCVA